MAYDSHGPLASGRVSHHSAKPIIYANEKQSQARNGQPTLPELAVKATYTALHGGKKKKKGRTNL